MMETIQILQPIQLFIKEVKNFPEEKYATLKQLESHLKGGERSKKFGVATTGSKNKPFKYWAGIAFSKDHPEPAGLTSFEVPQGTYLMEKVNDFKSDKTAIFNTFHKLLSYPQAEQSGYCVEIYNDDGSVSCLLTAKKTNSFSYSFSTQKPSKAVFNMLLNVENWWSGIYNETITGESQKPDDQFSFSAGEGMHFTRQKLIELIPDKKIVWRVIESKLSFLEDPQEWENTKIMFDILKKGEKTQVLFTHEGLEPQIECYDECSNAWKKYLHHLEQKLNQS